MIKETHGGANPPINLGVSRPTCHPNSNHLLTRTISELAIYLDDGLRRVFLEENAGEVYGSLPAYPVISATDSTRAWAS